MTIPEQIKSLQNLVDLAIKLQKDFPEDTLWSLQFRCIYIKLNN